MGHRGGSALYWLVAAMGLLGPAIVWDGGWVESEGVALLLHHTGSQTVLQKVFDPNATDFSDYQARELSHLINYVDAQAYGPIARVFDRHVLVPLSAIVTSLLLSVVLFVGIARTMPNIGPMAAAMLLACLLTSFEFMSTLSLFYRSGNPLLSALVLAVLFYVRHVQQERAHAVYPSRRRWVTRDGLVLLALAICGGLLDRQGFFYVLVACAVLGLHYRWTRRLGDLLVAVSVAAALLVGYDFVLAPAVIRQVNGYSPYLGFQAIQLGQESIVARPYFIASAVRYMVENIGVFLGGYRWTGAVVVVFAAVLLGRQAREGFQGAVWRSVVHSTSGRTLIYATVIVAAQVVAFALIMQAHPAAIEWFDHRYWYYPLPSLATLVFAIALLLNDAIPRLPGRHRWIPAAALLLIASSNLSRLAHHKAIMTSGPWFAEVGTQNQWLKASMRQDSPDPRLDVHYRRFFDFDRTLR